MPRQDCRACRYRCLTMSVLYYKTVRWTPYHVLVSVCLRASSTRPQNCCQTLWTSVCLVPVMMSLPQALHASLLLYRPIVFTKLHRTTTVLHVKTTFRPASCPFTRSAHPMSPDGWSRNSHSRTALGDRGTSRELEGALEGSKCGLSHS